MARRIKFRPTLREQQQQNLAAERHYASFAPAEKMAAAAERIQQLEAGIAPKRERAAPRQLEGPVVSAVSELLAFHPRVLIALRMNAGAASYEAKSGHYAPVFFHKWLRYPKKMRMPDFLCLVRGKFAMVVCGLEAKKPSWVKPVDDREREQKAFLDFLNENGSIGAFVRSVEEAKEAIERGW